MIATRETVRTVVSVGRLERDKLLSWLGLSCVLALSALLNFWNLSQNGYSNLYYSVAVQSMLQNFHNFFFASYDMGGFITVDKPPVALWVQAISAKLFGFSSLSLLAPQALAGTASVALLYFLVRRVFGTLAAFVAALALAITPIAVAVERTNNTDTMLMFMLLLAAWAITLATEKGQFKLLALSLALVGVAFNVKMLAAFVVLPVFYLLYFVAAPLKWHKRILHLALGSLVVFGVALSWTFAVDLTPPDQRPWVGGSQSNSVLELELGYNGLGRVTGNEQIGGRGFGGGGQRPPGGFMPPAGGFPGGAPGSVPGTGGNQASGGVPPPPGGFGGGGRGGIGGGAGGPGVAGMFGAGVAEPLRLFVGGELAEQWSWLFPLALFGVLAAVLALRRKLPLERRGQALLLWAGWLAIYGVVFSMAQGIFHPYYLIMLAPPTAALVGVGIPSLWRAYRKGGWQAWLLPAALLVTAIWQTKVLSTYPQWAAWIAPLTLGGSILMSAGLVLTRQVGTLRGWGRMAPGLLGIGLVALLLAPAVWSVTPVAAGPSNASLPVAGPAALNRNDPTSWTQLGSSANSALITYLEANNAGFFYLVAVPNSQQASSIALETHQPVLATGGFMGSDPALTADKLAEMVAGKQVRFVMGLDGAGIRGGSSAVSNWVQQNCSAVDASLYKDQNGSTGQTGGFGGFGRAGNSQLYDCAAK